MPKMFESLHQNLDRIFDGFWKYPDFVIDNEVRKLEAKNSDFRPTYNPTWGTDYIRFEFGTSALWDFANTNRLDSVVKKYPRFGVVEPKKYDKYVELALKRSPDLTRHMLYNHFLIFDMKGYEKRGLEEMLQIVSTPKYKSYSYYDPYSNEGIKTLKEARSLLPDRLSAAIDSNSITTSLVFLKNGSDLLEEIGIKFFNIKMK
jgi:hypothetical protein